MNIHWRHHVLTVCHNFFSSLSLKKEKRRTIPNPLCTEHFTFAWMKRRMSLRFSTLQCTASKDDVWLLLAFPFLKLKGKDFFVFLCLLLWFKRGWLYCSRVSDWISRVWSFSTKGLSVSLFVHHYSCHDSSCHVFWPSWAFFLGK